MDKGIGYYEHARLIGRPKPNINVICVYCKSYDVKPRSTRRIETAPDYFWRNYICKSCRASFWVGVQFETNETVYASTPPTLPSFYRMCILFSHEDVLASDYNPSNIPYNYGSITGSQYRTRELARSLAEPAMKDWENANQRAVRNLTPQQRNVLFAKTYSLYMDVVTRKDYTPESLRKATSEVTTQPPKQESNSNVQGYTDHRPEE